MCVKTRLNVYVAKRGRVVRRRPLVNGTMPSKRKERKELKSGRKATLLLVLEMHWAKKFTTQTDSV